MKTVRDIIEDCAEDYYPYHEYSGAYQDKNKESLDQALKEIEELLLESLPEWERLPKVNGECPENAQDFILATGYNECLYDIRKTIKELMK